MLDQSPFHTLDANTHLHLSPLVTQEDEAVYTLDFLCRFFRDSFMAPPDKTNSQQHMSLLTLLDNYDKGKFDRFMDSRYNRVFVRGFLVFLKEPIT